MSTRPKKKNVTMRQVITALLDNSNPFPPTYLHRFSDVEGTDLKELKAAWPQVADQRRFILLEDLEDLADADTLVSFDNVAKMALDDPDARVRTVAVRLLWDNSEKALAERWMRLLVEDPAVDVRAAAASALGKFIYLGELEELDTTLHHRVEEALLAAATGSDETLVRRRAVEALGFSSRPEVPGLIQQAYNHPDPDWLVTALFAMGRSADAVWEADVKRMLRHPKVEVQFEAVRAAGELSLETTRRSLLDLLDEEAVDTDVRSAAIWSLSQIGGEEVRETFEALLEEAEEEEDDDAAALLENALDNLDFTEDVLMTDLFDMDGLGLPGGSEGEGQDPFSNLGAQGSASDMESFYKTLIEQNRLPDEDDDDDDIDDLLTSGPAAPHDPPTDSGKPESKGKEKDRKRHRH